MLKYDGPVSIAMSTTKDILTKAMNLWNTSELQRVRRSHLADIMLSILANISLNTLNTTVKIVVTRFTSVMVSFTQGRHQLSATTMPMMCRLGTLYHPPRFHISQARGTILTRTNGTRHLQAC